MARLSAIMALAAMLAPSVAVAQDQPISLKLGSAPTNNISPMQLGIQCVRTRLDQQSKTMRFSVGEVRDYTGKFSNEASEGGFRITQGGTLMVISALGQLGQHVDLVERYDTRIAEQEIALARNQLVQDQGAGGAILRPLTAGQYYGSDYYIVGGVTEANYSISSGGAEVRVMGVGGGARYYSMNVAADLRLVDARTLRVIKTVSVQKQFVGHEVKGDTFRFFGTTLIDINAGKKKNEPLQLGVRATLEYGTLDLISAAFGQEFTPCQAHADYGYTAGVQQRLVKASRGGATQLAAFAAGSAKTTK
jgi:curli biogenesis system outer membrane secretion channel CsgG